MERADARLLGVTSAGEGGIVSALAADVCVFGDFVGLGAFEGHLSVTAGTVMLFFAFEPGGPALLVIDILFDEGFARRAGEGDFGASGQLFALLR